VDEKDRLGSKLRDVEKAREDQYAAERDRELLDKLRKKQAELHTAAAEATAAMGTLCPRCHRQLTEKKHGDLTVLACPADDGAWLDAAALKTVTAGIK
jgi:hypothetical protein